MRKLLLLLTFLTIATISKSQDFEPGTFKQDELDLKRYDKDTSAHAVVLSEFGKAEINKTNDEDKLKIIFHYHVKIKIFDNKGFDQATISIPTYHGDDDAEEIDDIKGSTTYVDDNGGVKQSYLDHDKIFTTKDNIHWSSTKFTLPNVHDGCIIEYSYTLYSPYWLNFPVWEFQSDIPKMSSEFDVHIPAYWQYNASLRGYLKLTKNVAEIESNCFSYGSNSVDCSHMDLGMKDIPAFVEEADMTAKKNFLSAVYFELAEYVSPWDGVKHKLAQTWADVDYSMKHDEGFGAQLRRKELMKDRITPVIAGITDSLQKAKAVYYYVQKNIKWNNFYGTYCPDGIRKALDNHSGSVADINIALTTALEAAGFDAEAVLLSVRDNGNVNKLYPAVTDFDYVIARVSIGGKSYFLDATDPLLSFGMLPMRCLNDQGRVMSLDKPSYWIDMTGIGQTETNTYNFDLTLQPDGKIKGTMTHYSTGYAAYEKRHAIKKFNSVDEYVESLDEKSPKFKILKSEVTNVDSLDKPLSEQYEIEIKAYKKMEDADKLTFNPFIDDYISSNPYKLTERTYPVDMGMPSNDRYTLTLHLPDGYTIENAPQDIGIALPNQGGRFITSYQADGNSFTFSHIVQFSKPVYSPAEYPYLKELFNKIILTQKAEMVLKKKS
jgi:transglutaminase-like putative cysteine protease